MEVAIETFLWNDCPAIRALLNNFEEHQTLTNSNRTIDPFFEQQEIINYMQTFHFNIPLLEEVISCYKMNFQIAQMPDLIDIVRMLDILGAEVRYKEYTLLLYDMLNTVMVEDARLGLTFHNILNQLSAELLLSYTSEKLPVSYWKTAAEFYKKYPQKQHNESYP
jgi:hypothetical protein